MTASTVKLLHLGDLMHTENGLALNNENNLFRHVSHFFLKNNDYLSHKTFYEYLIGM